MKIICSIGPKTNNSYSISKMISRGMNIARFNFSHINYENTKNLINFTKNNFPEVKILQDLQGNKIRVSNKFKKTFRVEKNDVVYFCSEVTYEKKYKYNKKNIIPLTIVEDISILNKLKTIYMKDGTMEFHILEICNDVVKTKVLEGGIVRGEKGVNIPNIPRYNMKLSKKDIKDITWGINNNVDAICLSYITCKENIQELKKYIKLSFKNSNQMQKLLVFGKIETKEAVENIDSILDEVDGIIIGRGDLFCEVSRLDIPLIQDKILEKCKIKNKIYILGTYVLGSMKRNREPTLNEIESLSKHITKKVDGFLFAGEISTGKYPLRVLDTLTKLIDKYS